MPFRFFQTAARHLLFGLGLVMRIWGGCSWGEANEGKIQLIPELFRTQDFPSAKIDSVAVWQNPTGGGLLFITAKKTDEVFVCDALKGTSIKTLGETGSKAGQFAQPNGIAVIDNLLLVVERDNHRVQVFRLPELEPLIVFGASELKLPYGLAVGKTQQGIRVFVTDDYPVPELDTEHEKKAHSTMESCPSSVREKLNQRVKVFLIQGTGSNLGVTHLFDFGDTTPEGALYSVESILVDAPNNRLFIADELRDRVLVYDLEGRFTGKILGDNLFEHDAEGMALFPLAADSPDGGVLIFCEQGKKRTLLHLFSRDTEKHLGVVSGDPELAGTDGITLATGLEGSNRTGVLYCVHDDLRVQAYNIDLDKFH